MGRILVAPLSPFEQDHLSAVISLGEYIETHDSLPNWVWVKKMEHREEINHPRFAYWHPNIDHWLHHIPPPINCHNPPTTICPPPCDYNPPGAVPEPTSLAILSIALVFVGVWRMLRR